MRCKCRRKLVKNGLTRSGTQRWKCLDCDRTSIRQKAKAIDITLLKKYLIEGQTISWLSKHYQKHRNTIRNYLAKAFLTPPKLEVPTDILEKEVWLATDATHFKRWGCLYITKATGVSTPLAVSFCQRECFETAVDHLQPLSSLLVTGYTTDGRRGLVTAYQQMFPQASGQRCLVHIQMRVRTLLTSRPKLEAGQSLLYLSNQLNKVKTTQQANKLLVDFSDWFIKYQTTVSQRTHKGRSWWYTHKNLRKAWRHILNAQDNMFVFLDHKNSTYHNNHLEGTFGQRKPSLYRHRGLSRTKVSAALLWTFYLLKKS